MTTEELRSLEEVNFADVTSKNKLLRAPGKLVAAPKVIDAINYLKAAYDVTIRATETGPFEAQYYFDVPGVKKKIMLLKDTSVSHALYVALVNAIATLLTEDVQTEKVA